MESPASSPPNLDVSRPALGFPLGIGLLLLVIVSLSGIFSCCHHWDKISSLRQSSANESSDIEQQPPSKPTPSYQDMMRYKGESLPVLMPGDKIPKFIALPCPCHPHRPEIDHIKVMKPPKIPRFPVPLY